MRHTAIRCLTSIALAAGFALALLSPVAAVAEPLVIAAGKPGGGYDRRALQIEERITAAAQ